MTQRTVGIVVMSVLLLAGCSDGTSETGSAKPAGVHSTDTSSSTSVTSANNSTDRDHDSHAKTDADDVSGHSASKSHSHTVQAGSHSHGHTHQSHNADTPQKIAEVAIGQKVPDFEITLNGATRRLSELQQDKSLTHDGVLAFTFWCSFCHSCRDVEHDLDQLATTHKGRAGVIALDASAGETEEAIREFAKKQELSMPIALNSDASVADLFGITTTTTTVVIDASGVLRYCGMFGDRNHSYAADALTAVLSGQDVTVATTEHRG